MDRSALPIYAVSGVEYGPSEALDFKSLIKEVFGKQIRRIGPFIQMALIGANDTIRSAPLPENTNVYLTSASGDMDVTIDVLNRTVRDRQVPKPLSFINTVSNAACYYFTKHFNIGGSTSFLSTREFALESAFIQACLDITTLGVETALVGSVDIITQPETTHRIRVGALENDPLAQGSHWFRLGQPNSDKSSTEKPLGYLIDAFLFRDANALINHVKPLLKNTDKISFGNRIKPQTKQEIQSQFENSEYALNIPAKGHYGTNAGHVLRDYLTHEKLAETQLVYIQENTRGELSFILLQKP